MEMKFKKMLVLLHGAGLINAETYEQLRSKDETELRSHLIPFLDGLIGKKYCFEGVRLGEDAKIMIFTIVQIVWEKHANQIHIFLPNEVCVISMKDEVVTRVGIYKGKLSKL